MGSHFVYKTGKLDLKRLCIIIHSIRMARVAIKYSNRSRFTVIGSRLKKTESRGGL
jgi:hypothetical protein